NTATDTATVNTTPVGAPSITITTDTDNDGVINKAELGAATTVSVKTDLPTSAVAGDTISVTDGTTTKTHVLTSADITAKSVSDTFTAPAEGGTINVSATLTPAASGNVSSAGTDSATIDTTAPNGGVAPTVQITTDTNNDATVSASELGSATTFAVKGSFDGTKVAVGDKLVFSDGTNTKVVLLTADDVTAGFATTTFAKPAEGGTLTVTAALQDSVGNTTPQSASDSAKLDTTAPNANLALTLTIDTDANNDGFVNFTEIGNNAGKANSTLNVSAAFDKTKVAVGDIVTITDTATGGVVKTITLTQAMVDAGKVSTSFTSAGDGSTFNVKATIQDPLGNTAPVATDSAVLDLSNLNPVDPLSPDSSKLAVVIEISTDANNDTFLNVAEINGATKASVKVTLPTDAKAGDKLVVTGSGNADQTFVLTQAQIDAKLINTTFNLPANGSKLDVSAQVSDSSGNTSNLAKDSATVNTNTTGAPTIEISTDSNNDGFINKTELGTSTTVSVKTSLPTGAALNDVVTVTDGSAVKTHKLTQSDITAGFVTDTYAKPAEGAAITVSATLTTVAGNVSSSGTDKATLDTSGFVDPNNTSKTGLKVVIDTDGNNDTLISQSELTGTKDLIKATVTLTGDAAVGDTLTVKASGNTDRTIILTAADIQAGKVVLTDLSATGDNTTFTVTASLKDSALNTSPAPDASDTATIKTSSTGAPVVTITEDSNNDGVINANELIGSVDIVIALPAAAKEGDKLNVDINGTPQTITLSATDINNHAVSLTTTAPSNGGTITVKATLTDSIGNVSPEGSDKAVINSTIPNDGKALTLTIDTDANNDAFVNFAEIGNTAGTPNTTLTVSAAFDKSKVAVGDIVTITDTATGGAVKTITLT
ncbi:MAG: hypothetical protein CFE39_17560, partial [Comamonadaceae bacterium PBBC2]